jgi:acyl-homoserine-lactone acylase
VWHLKRPSAFLVGTLTSASAMAMALLGTISCGKKDADPEYRATIRRTSHGVAHITADDLGGVGFGQGYALAQDHGCTLAEQVLKVRSERAKFFGPGEDDIHLNTDLAYLHMGIYESAQDDFSGQPEDVQDLIRGFAAGYSTYLAEVGSEGFPGPCAGEPWVRPIDEIDLFAYYLEVSMLASGRQFTDFMATAQPPGSALTLPGGDIRQLAGHRNTPLGSNGWALGKDLTENGHGMLLGNPHFPWEGELRLWESHLTVPGELDVYGVGLIGVPGVLIGFNEGMAWTHTVSDGQRFTAYLLNLVPGDPTSYYVDGQPTQMESQEYSIDVLGEGGKIETVTRTLYRSKYGPILNIDSFSWTSQHAFTLRDANAGNRELVSQFTAMNRATTMDEFQAAHREHMGVPWVNTISVSADGRAWYMDSTPTPNLSAEAISFWEDQRDFEFFTKALYESEVVMLQAESRDEWVEEDGAREPGLVPYDDMPQLERSDFVFNANDSHWMSHTEELLEGYSPLHGFERTVRTPRTRMNARILSEGAGGHSGSDGLFSLEEFQEAALANRSFMAEQLGEEIVARCQGAGPVHHEGQDVEITAICAAIAGWDLRYDLESVGAVAFREVLGDYAEGVYSEHGTLWETPFDPDDPLETPTGLAAAGADDDDRILEALAGATLRLEEAGIAVDAALGEVQFTKTGLQDIPIHGAGRSEGVTNLIVYSDSLNSSVYPPMEQGEVIHSRTGLSEEGYVVNYGTSFIMTVEFTDDGPRAQALLTYGQSDDPSTGWIDDQTELFSAKQWRDCLFSEEQILADPNLTEVEVSGSAAAGG